jgi:hypothetical protein
LPHKQKQAVFFDNTAPAKTSLSPPITSVKEKRLRAAKIGFRLTRGFVETVAQAPQHVGRRPEWAHIHGPSAPPWEKKTRE